MNMPGFSGEASVYRTGHHYRAAVSGIVPAQFGAAVTPQACGWIKGGVCGVAIAGGTVLCTAACLTGPAQCVGCWTGALAIVGYGFCRDCIPAWMRAVIDAVGGGGGGSGGGGG